ncbi:MAG: UDP-3-O-(3-hydroxymyristoyl)glucosamine N-acyltransferase, partial [Planctomycetaceae bacterium]
ALARLKPARRPAPIGPSPQAFVDPGATIGKDTNIHPGATIASDVVIGDRCEIQAGVRIGPGCRIGDDVQLDPNVVLYHEVLIGNRVTIQAGSVIGAIGFGYRTREGRHERIPHYGTVRIEDDVDIGACSTIDRGVIGETVVGEGTKIDNNVVIAHNCRLGRHNLLVSQVGFAGSVTTGDYVVCAGQVGIADHVTIGAGAILGAKAGVHKDLAGGKTYLGAPAAPIEETTRAVMTMQKLPQLRQSLRELERQVAALRKQVEGGAHPQQPAA